MNITFEDNIELLTQENEKKRYADIKINFWFDVDNPMLSLNIFRKEYDEDSDEYLESINDDDDKYLQSSVIIVDDTTEDAELRIKTLIGALEGFLNTYRRE